MIPLIPIEGSSNIDAHGYDESSQTLAVRFKSGAIYHYQNVERDVAAEFTEADSLGNYLAKNIRGVYPHVKLDPEDGDG